MSDYNDHLDESYSARQLGDQLAEGPSAADLNYERLREQIRWHLKKTPYHVQLACLHRAYGNRGFGYYLEQGLGKTGTALNEFMELLAQDAVDIMIVIAPPTFLLDWQAAVIEWVHEPFPTYAWPMDPRAPTVSMGPGRPRRKLDEAIPPFLFAINWEMMRQAAGQEIVQALCEKYRVFLVEDETSYIKNNKSAVMKGTLAAAKEASVLRGLNGTPLTQNFTDIYAQYRCLRLWDGVNFTAWRNKFAKVGGFMGKKIEGVKPHMIDQFKREVSKHCFRAMKKDWSDLPPKVYTTRNYEMTRQQAEIYYSMQEEFWVEIGTGEIEAEMAISQRLKLQQIASGFALDEFKVAHRIMPPDKNPKLLALVADIRLTPGKVLVPRFFTESAEMLMEAFEAEGLRFLNMPGGMKKEALIDLKREFNENDSIDGMVLSLDAGRMGHTLLGSDRRRCSDMKFFEGNYNLLSRLQIEDRNHRWGQDAEFCRYTDYAGSQAERDIAEALQQKKDMADVLINSVRALPQAA